MMKWRYSLNVLLVTVLCTSLGSPVGSRSKSNPAFPNAGSMKRSRQTTETLHATDEPSFDEFAEADFDIDLNMLDSMITEFPTRGATRNPIPVAATLAPEIWTPPLEPEMLTEQPLETSKTPTEPETQITYPEYLEEADDDDEEAEDEVAPTPPPEEEEEEEGEDTLDVDDMENKPEWEEESTGDQNLPLENQDLEKETKSLENLMAKKSDPRFEDLNAPHFGVQTPEPHMRESDNSPVVKPVLSSPQTTNVSFPQVGEGLKTAINIITTHAKQFIARMEDVNEKTFKSMTEMVKQNTGEDEMTGEFNAMLESWKQICSGSEDVTEQFLKKMSLICSTHRSPAISERILTEVRQYIQLYTNSIVKRHNSVMDVAFVWLNKSVIRPVELNLLKQLMEHNNIISKQSIRTIQNYVELLTRLAKSAA